MAKRFPGWGACAGFVEVPLEITSRCCRAELGPGGELVFKQILLLAAVGDEGASSHLAVNSAWLQRSCHGAQSGGGKTLLVSRGSGAKPWAGSSSRWQRLCSSPAGLRGSELLRRQKTAPENKQLMEGVEAHPGTQPPSRQGRGEESGAGREPAAMLRGGSVPVAPGRARLAQPRAPAVGAARRWRLGSCWRASVPQGPALVCAGACRALGVGFGKPKVGLESGSRC